MSSREEASPPPAKRRRLNRGSSKASRVEVSVESEQETVIMQHALGTGDTPTPVPDIEPVLLATEPTERSKSIHYMSPPPLPDPLLLLLLPSLLIAPPSSPLHFRSLYLSLLALRRCIRLDLTADLEVRARCGVAEVGLLVLGAELDGGERWVKGVENEVEDSISKGLLLAQKHPTLSSYLTPLTALRIRLAALQHRSKYALSLSRAALSPLSSLQHIQHAHLLAALQPTTTAALAHLGPEPTDPRAAHLRLSLVLTHQPDKFGDALANLPMPESGDDMQQILTHLLTLLHSLDHPPPGPTSNSQPASSPISSILAALPTLLDAPLPHPSNPLFLHSSTGPPKMLVPPDPKIIIATTCLMASIAKRDASGRTSKRGAWATQGLKVLEEPMGKLPRWCTMREKNELERRCDKLKADLLCEAISVGIMRSEFGEALSHLNALCAHIRDRDLWNRFVPLLTLLHARLAHALSLHSRALSCYAAAHHLATLPTLVPDMPVALFARVGEAWLRLGMDEEGAEAEVRRVVEEVKGSGQEGLRASAKVMEAVLEGASVKGKQHLKSALHHSTSPTSDNHLRALVLTLTASSYALTRPAHALDVLEAARQAALSMNPAKDGQVGLGLWIGERVAEIYRRQGHEKEARKREAENERLKGVIAEQAGRWAYLAADDGGINGGGHGAGNGDKDEDEDEGGDVTMTDAR